MSIRSWEGFALEQVLRLADRRDAYFWSTQSGAELDLLLFENGRRIGYEFKYAESPIVTRSMRIAVQDLRLDELRIVCLAASRTRRASNVDAIEDAAEFMSG